VRVDSSGADKQLDETRAKQEVDRVGTQDVTAYLEDIRRTADVRKNPKAFE
jgi:hypothetical protein